MFRIFFWLIILFKVCFFGILNKFNLKIERMYILYYYPHYRTHIESIQKNNDKEKNVLDSALI